MLDELSKLNRNTGDRIGRCRKDRANFLTMPSSYLIFAIFLFGFTVPARPQDGPPAGANPSAGPENDTVFRSWRLRHFESAKREALEKFWAKELREFRTVDPTDLANYKDFLSEAKTGIFRLLPNFDCVAKEIIKVDGECTGYVPESSDFSFRSNTYAEPRDHDIGYVRDEFISNALFSQGILVDLGDVPIEKVTLENNGLKFLAAFQPDVLALAARDHAREIK